MTKTERQAAIDAIRQLLNIPDDEDDNGPGPTGPQLPPEFIDAWNKILTKYDDDNIPDADLIDLLEKIQNGDITSLTI